MVVAEEVSKKELREYAFSIRKNFSYKEELENSLIERLLHHEKIIENQDILVYLSKNDEVPTMKLIEHLLSLKKNIYAPCIINNEIEFYKLNSLNDVEIGKFNILEPLKNEKWKGKKGCILIPGLLFDKDNNRLGYGKGYYDKYLKKNSYLYKIGICFSEFLVNKLVIEEHDIKMDEIVMEK